MSNKFFEFLRNRRNALVNSKAKTFYFVLGNESADLDSIICSLVYSYFLQRKFSKSREETIEAIPIIWIEQESLRLRTEVIALFDKYGLKETDFVYKADVNFQDYINNIEDKEIKIILVDHNHKTCHDNITNYVYTIIDHHEDTYDHKNVINKTINLVGSCSTLIAQELYYENKDVLNIKPIADFLLAAILIDTINLDLHAGRTKELDIFFAEILSQYSKIDGDQLFLELQNAKMNIDSLSTYDILRKDFKKVISDHLKVNIGFSSATMLPLVLLNREDFSSTAQRYSAEQNIELLVICFLCYGDNGDVERFLYVFTENEVMKEIVIKQLLDSKDKLQLDEKNEMLKGLMKHGSQHSRKVILPMIKQFSFQR